MVFSGGATLPYSWRRGGALDLGKLEEDHRPWGYYRVLADEPDHKVKRIVVYPGQRLSLQRHRRRSEHWFFVQGRAVVTRGEEEIPVQEGSSVDIPLGSWHRVSNPGKDDAVFIEVQTGDYFGEDDIERAEDDYGRLGVRRGEKSPASE
jgi:mannose-6-phosphate isomerase